jgi:hypothetical protein
MPAPSSNEPLDPLDPRTLAHERLDFFHKLCDDYNNDGLVSLAQRHSLTGAYQELLRPIYSLFEELHRKAVTDEEIDASKAYLTFCAKILLRLSYLHHEGRKETPEEAADYYLNFGKKIHLIRHPEAVQINSNTP